MKWASEIAVCALGLLPTGKAYSGPATNCAMCGRPIAQKDVASPLDLPKTFTDHAQLGDSGTICGWCKTVSEQRVLRPLQRACITSDGIYNLNTDNAKTWFWMTPPAPPFVMVINHHMTAAFHYVWRTPVTLDSRLISMNVDGRIYTVNRARILDAIPAAKTLLDGIRLQAGEAKSHAFSPFVSLNRSPGKIGRDAGNGRLSGATRMFLESKDADETHHQAATLLTSLTTGELMALSLFVKSDPSLPEQPPVITSLTQRNSEK